MTRLALALVPVALALSNAVTLAATVPSHAQAAERVVIEFRNGRFALLEQIEVRKVLPPSDGLPAQQVSGFYYELRSGAGVVRYRRVIGDPIRTVFEGPATPGAGAPDRIEAIPALRTFALLVPAPEQGDELVIFSSPLKLGANGEVAAEVARFALSPIVIP